MCTGKEIPKFISGDKPVVAARDAKGLKYKMEEEFSVENFKTFLTLLEAGEVDPWIKSEAVPDNSANSVKVDKIEIILKNINCRVISFSTLKGFLTRPLILPYIKLKYKPFS